jgi:hypothetical protein
MKNLNIKSNADLEAILDHAAKQIEESDNTINNQYIINLTDAEKLSLHVTLQMHSAMNGNPEILKTLISKAAKMEKIPTDIQKN